MTFDFLIFTFQCASRGIHFNTEGTKNTQRTQREVSTHYSLLTIRYSLIRSHRDSLRECCNSINLQIHSQTLQPKTHASRLTSTIHEPHSLFTTHLLAPNNNSSLCLKTALCRSFLPVSENRKPIVLEINEAPSRP